jgi:hypothetical protein
MHWTADSRLKLVTVVAEGDVGRADVEGFLAMATGADLLHWRKLFDARTAQSGLTLPEATELGVRIRAAHEVRTVGPLALVMPPTASAELMRLLGFLAAARRPMRIFRQLEPARKWVLKASSP